MASSPTATPAYKLNNVLVDLQASLRAFHSLLIDPPMKEQLFRSLHDDIGLPDAEVSASANNIVDLLSSIEHLLEPAPLKLADHFLGYMTSKCLVAAVELDIASHLSKGPLNLADLASAAHAKPDRLGQILRPLYTNNIFSYSVTGEYANNHVSQLLRTDHWTQWHNWVNLYGNQFYEIASGIPKAVRDDGQTRSAAQVVFDTDDDMFTYFQRRGWVPQLHRTLGAGANAMGPGILADYPWHELADTTVLDIGGGGGALTASLLRRHSSMRGAIFDLPAVIEHARAAFQSGGNFADVGARVTRLIPGDFLEKIPAFTTYTMKWVLHDWKDGDAANILSNVRAAIMEGPASRLIILESVLSDSRSGRLSVYGDVNMMMTANGQERTEKEWMALAAETGWTVHGIHPMRNAWVQAIDLRPAQQAKTQANGVRRTLALKEKPHVNGGKVGLYEDEDSAREVKTEVVRSPNDVSGAGKADVETKGAMPDAAAPVSQEEDHGGTVVPANEAKGDSPPGVAAVQIRELGDVIQGDVEADGERVVIYVIKADQTSYINYIKPLMLAVELNAPHVLSMIDTKDEWYFSVHPQRMVPALKDRDPATGDDFVVFESTACLQYLCERFDKAGTWAGKTAAEKGTVLAWTAYQTAALGPTAKYWLYFLRGYPNRQNPIQLPQTIEQLHKDTLRQWDILEKRLGSPGQGYVALRDRPTIADLSYLPFSMPYIFKLFGVDIQEWPHIDRWSHELLSRPAVKAVLDQAPKLGH